MAFKIIAFDSDGVGAIGSALALQLLDPKGELVRRADMFAGNAMAAVTALELVNGVSLDRILKFFRARPGAIFKARNSSPQYSSEPMAEAVGKLFGMARLSELPLSGPKVMVNVEQLIDPDVDEWKAIAIGSGRHDPCSEMLLADLALAACSADGFFEPHSLPPINRPSTGTFRMAKSAENNPSAAAMAYAEEHFNVDQADIQVLSIGLGGSTTTAKVKNPERNWGWSFSRIAKTVRQTAGLDTVDSNCRVSALGDRYVRVEVDPSREFAFDDWQTIPDIESMVRKKGESHDWQRTADVLRQTWKETDPLIMSEQQASVHGRLR